MILMVVLAAVVALLLLITWLRLHPFVSLILVAIGTGAVLGMPLDKVVNSVKDGMGNTLGFVGIVLALGTMLGKMLAESGGAERIAKTLIDLFGPKRVHWAMMCVAFLVGIPVFFQVGFVLLLPLVFAVAAETGISLVTIGIPLVAGLSIVHGLVPPHPAAMAAVDTFKADVGKTILYALLVGLPSAVVAGPLFGKWIGGKIHKNVPEEIGKQLTTNKTKELPGFGITLFTVLLPVLLMLLSTLADLALPKQNPWHTTLKFVGDPIVSLLLSALFSFWSLGYARRFSRDEILRFTNECLAPTANILLVIGGGGAFNKVLLDSGAGEAMAQLAKEAHLSPLLMAWAIAALIRVATGSATVAMITSAGIVAPVAASVHGASPELLVLATGAGSLILSHVNDSGFWMIKEFFGMSVKETWQTWTAMETILSVTALILILLLSLAV
jgi:GntP family gluconate:H+ symporter